MISASYSIGRRPRRPGYQVYICHMTQYLIERAGGSGDISKRVKLRQQLQCHSFQWYLDNVYPEKDYMLDKDLQLTGSLVALKQEDEPWLCIDAANPPNEFNPLIGHTPIIYPCHGEGNDHNRCKINIMLIQAPTRTSSTPNATKSASCIRATCVWHAKTITLSWHRARQKFRAIHHRQKIKPGFLIRKMLGFEMWSATLVSKGDMAKKLNWQSATRSQEASDLSGKQRTLLNTLSTRCKVTPTDSAYFVRYRLEVVLRMNVNECTSFKSRHNRRRRHNHLRRQNYHSPYSLVVHREGQM